MKKLSRRLSPKAKKALLQAKPGDWIKGTVLLDANASYEAFVEGLRELGVQPGSWHESTHQMALALPVDCLESVLALPQVRYFEAATAYSYSPDAL